MGFVVGIVVGCGGAAQSAVQPTVYQEYNAIEEPGHPAGGYLDRKIARNVYLVTFRGTPPTAQETVIQYAYRRAAELCGGDDSFDVLKDEDASKIDERTEGVWGGGFGVLSANSETIKTVWPRRRLTIRCKDD